MKSPVKIAIFLVVAAIFAGGGEYLDRSDTGRRFNQNIFLEILCGTTEQVGGAEVTFVGVNDSEKDHFESWPPPRLDWAVILNLLGPGAEAARKKLSDEGVDPNHKFHNAPALGIVSPLTWDDADDVLARMAMRERALLISWLINGVTLGPAGAEGAAVDPAKLSQVAKIEGDTSRIPEAGSLVGFPDESLAIAGASAFTHIELAEQTESSPDGILIPLLARAGDKVLASFPLQMILAKESLNTANVSVRLAEEGSTIEIRRDLPEGQAEGDGEIAFRIPVDQSGQLLVYPGVREGRLYPKLDAAADLILASSDYEVADQVRGTRASQLESLTDLILASFGYEVADQDRETRASQLESLSKNAVIVGFDHDDVRQFELPGGDLVSRAELMAMAVATVQSGRYIKLWPDWMRYAGIGSLAFLGILLVPTRLISRDGLFFAIIILIGYLTVSMLVFQTNLTWTPPLAAIGICLALAVAGWIFPSIANTTEEPKPAKKPEEKEKAAEKPAPGADSAKSDAKKA